MLRSVRDAPRHRVSLVLPLDVVVFTFRLADIECFATLVDTAFVARDLILADSLCFRVVISV